MLYSYRWSVPRIFLKEKNIFLTITDVKIQGLLLMSRQCSSAAKGMESKAKERRSRPFKVNSIGDLTEDKDGWEACVLVSATLLGPSRALQASPADLRFPSHVALWGDSTRSTYPCRLCGGWTRRATAVVSNWATREQPQGPAVLMRYGLGRIYRWGR